MKNNYTFLLLLFISLSTFAQDKKLSAEINYPLGFSNGAENYTGIIDVGLKYRFAKGEVFHYGASVTFDYLKATISFNNEDLNRDYYFYHANGFTEMTIPSIEKFHPFAGAGFTYMNYSYEYLQTINGDTTKQTIDENNLGFNFKLGFQYDVNDSFFLQSYYHYIRTFKKSEILDETIGINYNQVKFGLGFRF